MTNPGGEDRPRHRGREERADGRGGAEAMLPLVPHLRAYARALTGGSEHAADDLVQDTLVRALQAWGRFTPGTNLKAWLFTILRNRHLTVRRRERHRAEVGVDDLEPLATAPAFQEGLAELRHFKAAFARLAPSHREVLVLWAVHGLPYERIAEVVGCDVGSVKSRMNRARTALKRMLLGDGREAGPSAGPVPRGGGRSTAAGRGSGRARCPVTTGPPTPAGSWP